MGRGICFLLILMGILAAFLPADVKAAPTTRRLAGYTQYDTAAVVAKAGWTQADYAVLAYGENFPDALAAVPLARKYNAPILLSDVQSLPEVTSQILQELGVRHVLIAGGTAVISTAAENQLQVLGIQVTRIAGYDRYDTSVEIAKQLDAGQEIFVVNGDDYADALSVSVPSALKNAPVILVPEGYLPESVQQYLQTQTITKTYLVGNAEQIKESTASGFPYVERITGEDKYVRNIAVLKRFEDILTCDDVFLATGNRFADALAGGAYAASQAAPIVLLDSSYNRETADWLISRNSVLTQLSILGGEVIMPGMLIREYTDALAGKTSGTVYTPAELAEMARPSLVHIETKDAYGTPLLRGGGVIVDAAGKIATNYQLLKNAYAAEVTTYDGKVYEAGKVCAYDTKQNVAILKIEAAGLLPVVWGDSEQAAVGDKVYTVGNYYGISESMTDGMISTKARAIDSITYMQITAAVAAGDYGGLLLNEQGKMIGLTAPGVSGAESLNLALPINSLKKMFAQDNSLTLEQISRPGTSDPDAVKKTDEEFASFLNSKYNAMTIDGLTVRFTWKVNDYQSGSADLSIHGMMESGDLGYWLELIDKEQRGEMLLFFGNLSGEIKRLYPDTTFMGNVLFQDYYYILPPKPYFPYNEVSYTSDGKWFVSHPVVTFYDLYPQGKSDARVMLTD